MVVDRLKLAQTSRKLERALVRAKQFAEHNAQSEELLNEIFEYFAFLEETLEDDPVAVTYFKQEASIKNLLAYLAELEDRLAQSRAILDAAEESRTRAKLFLEHFRDHQHYAFESPESCFAFLSRAHAELGVSHARFKPQFLGTADLSLVVRDLGLSSAQNQVITVPAEKIAPFLERVFSKNALRKARLDSDALRVTFESAQNVFVEAENPRIRRLDQLHRSAAAQQE